MKKIGVILGAFLGFLLVIFLTKEQPPKQGIEPLQDADGVYLITKREELVWFLKRTGKVSIDVRLTKDLVLNDTSNYENWGEEPPAYRYDTLSSFAGTFDGDGHAIVGYYPEDAYMRGHHVMFGNIREGGCVKNLILRESYLGASYEERTAADEDFHRLEIPVAAGLCQYNNGTIENCEINIKVAGDGTAAGIAIYNGGVIRSCKFVGELTAGRSLLRRARRLQIDKPLWYAGGIAAVNLSWGVIEDCENESEIVLYTEGMRRWRDTNTLEKVQKDSCAGGIVGWNQGRVENCKSIASTPLIGLDQTDSNQTAKLRIQREKEEKKDQIYTIKEGDSLWNIAERFYGAGYHWEILFQANQIEDADRILIGEELVIPEAKKVWDDKVSR